MSPVRRVVVLGTHNRKKGQELAGLLAPFKLQLKTLCDFENPLDVEEHGDTFAANAALKACQQASWLRHWVLGEDSGLAVDALDGRPGVHSARYAGPDATDEANIEKLLAEMQPVPPGKRGAHYVSHMTLADPQGIPRADTEASCHGRIAPARRGSGGFGYDPVFEIAEYHMTFGELGNTVKAILSHRGRATRRMLPHIVRLLGDYTGRG
ncbi:MAG: non-canonical purine NTP pyrophosphatase [Pirellulaceae bacterium]